MTNGAGWAVILAGGDGSRLQSLTRFMAGDDRPKQFCPMFGGRTLLAETMARVAHSVPSECTLYAVTRRHEPFYRRDLGGVRRSLVVEQPSNRGTAAAITCALTRLRELGATGLVDFYPADHYYTNPAALRRTMAAVHAAGEEYPDRIVVVGAEALQPETDYGWIQAGAVVPVSGASVRARAGIRQVTHFWEKPSGEVAAQLLEQGCLWNTFVTVGRIDAFESLIQTTQPGLWAAFEPLRQLRSAREEAIVAEEVYAQLGSADFSRDVLSRSPERLIVATLSRNAGWTDLGQPSRVFDVLGSRGLPCPKLRLAAS